MVEWLAPEHWSRSGSRYLWLRQWPVTGRGDKALDGQNWHRDWRGR
jgi:hypothetical protein